MQHFLKFFTRTDLKKAGISKAKFAKLMEEVLEDGTTKVEITPSGVWVQYDRKE